MGSFVFNRLLALLPMLLAVSFLVFLMISLVPGDPVATMLGPESTEDQAQILRHQLGLDRPFQERLASWYADALRGDLGESYFLNQPVTTAIASRIPVTLSLTIFALFVSVIVGTTAGVIASLRQGRFADWGIMFLAILGLSIPVFWLALNLMFIFSVRLGWFPTTGYVPLREDPVEYFRHLLLPGLTLGAVNTAVIARMTRSSMLEVLRQDFVRTADAKGLSRHIVVIRHAFRNALLPIVTVIGLSVGELLAGSVITETVFNLPGIGRLIVDAIRRRDYPTVQGGILFVTVIYLLVNLAVDLLYAWINPRIRYR